MVGYFVQVVRNGSGGFRHRRGRTACWYVGGADVASARQRGEAPHVDADQPGKGLGFSIAENRELRCELLDGAVPLAQLDAGERCRERRFGFNGGCGGHETVTAQRCGQCLRPCGDIRSGGVDLRRVAAFHVGKALDGELPDRVGSGDLAKALQGQAGNIKVVIAKR